MMYSNGNFYDPGFMNYNLDTVHMRHGLWGDDYNIDNLWQAPRPCQTNPMGFMSRPMFNPQCFAPTYPQALGGYYNSLLASQSMPQGGGMGATMNKMFGFMMAMKQMNMMENYQIQQKEYLEDMIEYKRSNRNNPGGSSKRGGGSGDEDNKKTISKSTFDITDKKDDVEDLTDFINDGKKTSKLKYGSVSKFVNNTYKELLDKKFDGEDDSAGKFTLDEFQAQFDINKETANKVDLNGSGFISEEEYTQFLKNIGVSDKETTIKKDVFTEKIENLEDASSYAVGNEYIDKLKSHDDVTYKVKFNADKKDDAIETLKKIAANKEITSDDLNFSIAGTHKKEFYEHIATNADASIKELIKPGEDDYSQVDITSEDVKAYFKKTKLVADKETHAVEFDGDAITKDDAEDQAKAFIELYKDGFDELDGDLELNFADADARKEFFDRLQYTLDNDSYKDSELRKIINVGKTYQTDNDTGVAEVASFMQLTNINEDARNLKFTLDTGLIEQYSMVKDESAWHNVDDDYTLGSTKKVKLSYDNDDSTDIDEGIQTTYINDQGGTYISNYEFDKDKGMFVDARNNNNYLAGGNYSIWKDKISKPEE